MTDGEVTLFLCGDVMTGRGIDQILLHPSKPQLYEPYVRDAGDYVALAERASGRLNKPVAFDYIWGDALSELERRRPDARIINLETAVTRSEEAWPGKGIHYRMNPSNVPCITAAQPDCCVLANNHVLDWGRGGLEETLDTLHRAHVRTAGAGRDLAQAAAPAIIPLDKGKRVLVYACASESSGVLAAWAASEGRSGVCPIDEFSARAVSAIAQRVHADRVAGDIIVLSIHWGENWGFEISRHERAFAHRLTDEASVDVVHGHSSHHVRGVEVYRGKPILYGCGDFLNDYEGIAGHERYRPDLALMYFPTLEAESGRLLRFDLAPMRVRRMRVNRAPQEGIDWLAARLNREGARLATRVEVDAERGLRVCW